MARQQSETSAGERLKAFAKERFGGIGRMADETDIPVGTLYKWTSNQARPDAEHMQRLNAAGLNLRWYLEGVGEMEADVVAESSAAYESSALGSLRRQAERLRRIADSLDAAADELEADRDVATPKKAAGLKQIPIDLENDDTEVTPLSSLKGQPRRRVGDQTKVK